MKIFAGFIEDQLENRVRLDSELTEKPITIFYDYPLRDLSELTHNPYNILFIQEPNQLFGFHDWTLNYGHLFDLIFTWGHTILEKYPNNSLFFPFANGNYQMDSKYQINKKFEVSFLCGSKTMIEGHHLRHKIYSREADVKMPKHFLYTAPWDGGKDRCWESMYHISVENSRNKNYFTEKIIDAFISKTIPIYWGCPNIDEFFNKDGIITFNNETELIDIINNLTPEYYESKMDAINENYLKAIEGADFIGRVNSIVKDICKTNSI